MTFRAFVRAVAVGCALAGPAIALCPAPATALEGIASTYGREVFRINPSRRTANGEIFQPMARTAAIWSVPFNTRLRVTCLKTGRSVVVRINDRGPHKRLGRLIDLSTGSARALGMNGLARVRVEIVSAAER